MADQEQAKYDGPERRTQPEQKFFTPQFIFQILTWFFAQIIAACVIYVGVSNRLTTIEVRMDERKTSADREMDAEVGARKLLESRIIVLEKVQAEQAAYLKFKAEAERQQQSQR